MSDLDQYQRLCREHRWQVPARYNIAADVCDKHPRDKPAMVWESFDGARRELTWGELQDMANQAAHTLADAGRRSAVTGWRWCCRRRPRPPRVFFGVWKLGAVLLALSVLYGDDGIAPPRWATRRPACWSPTRPTPAASPPTWPTPPAGGRRRRLRRRSDRPRRRATPRADDPAQLYYTSGHDRDGQGRSCTPTATCSAHEEFVYCHEVQRRGALPRHGRVGVGGRDRAAARPVAAGRGAVRLPPRGRLRRPPPARLPAAGTASPTSSRRRPRCGR